MITETQDSPFISVIIPAYNRELFLSEAIESILRQTYKNFEFIIADDGSIDGTAILIRKYSQQDSRIRPVFLPHKGLPPTLNIAVSLSKGPVIAFMDSDDIATPDRLEVLLRWMQAKKLDVCGSHVEVFGTATDPLGGKDGIVRLPESHGVIIREFLFQIPLWQGTLMLKKSLASQHPFDETMDCADEWPYRIAPQCVTGNVPRVLLHVRRHGNNITTTLRARHQLEATRSRFKYFYRLFPRTPLPDYIAFARLADCEPMTNLWELERAGQWLTQFASYPDDQLKKRMGQRWEAVCKRSNNLGDEVKSILDRYKSKIE